MVEVSVYFCQGGASANQVFSLSRTYQLRREEVCSIGFDGGVRLVMCTDSPDQKWSYSTETKVLTHVNTGLCVDTTGVKNGERVKLNKCMPNTPGQIWEFQHYME